MSNPIFYIVDVFAEEKFAGNQLAVFRNCRDFTDTQMQKIALEMNYSETTFILSEDMLDGGFDVRIFTPKNELAFAGHPTLGTAYVIQREIIGKEIELVNLNLKVGQIPVAFFYKKGETDILWMRQVPPGFGVTVDSAKIAKSLNIDISDMDERFPVREVSTGIPTLIAPLKSLKAVKKSRIDNRKFNKLTHGIQAKTIMVFSPETYNSDNNLNARFFADFYGIPEDPATGSAAGCLAGYLAEYAYFGRNRLDIRVEQGYEINRQSLLYLKANKQPDQINVEVGGKVYLVATGELKI